MSVTNRRPHDREAGVVRVYGISGDDALRY